MPAILKFVLGGLGSIVIIGIIILVIVVRIAKKEKV